MVIDTGAAHPRDESLGLVEIVAVGLLDFPQPRLALLFVLAVECLSLWMRRRVCLNLRRWWAPCRHPSSPFAADNSAQSPRALRTAS